VTLDLGMPLGPEVALAALAVLVLFVGLVRQGDPGHTLGWVAFVGVLLTLGLTFAADEGGCRLVGVGRSGQDDARDRADRGLSES